MAFNEIEMEKYRILVSAYVKKRRPPEHIRDKVDLEFRIKGHSVEIFEIRPMMFKPHVKAESAIAKATYVRTQRVWKVYWQKSDFKWHGYPGQPEVRDLEEFLELVEEDSLCCFWG